MAISIGDNFGYRSAKPNFERDSFDTLADMASYPETGMDDGHISYCKETDKHYKFLKSNTIDASTGKWRVFSQDEIKIGSGLTKDSDNRVSVSLGTGLYYSTNGSIAVKEDVVRDISSEEVAKVVANAPEDYDTLKEIAEYIASDKTNAAQINNSISNINKELEKKSPNLVGGYGISLTDNVDNTRTVDVRLHERGSLSNTTGGLEVKVGTGLVKDGNSAITVGTEAVSIIAKDMARVLAGDGLEFVDDVTNLLKVKVGGGLEVVNDAIRLSTLLANKVKNGIVVSTSEVGAVGKNTLTIGSGLAVVPSGDMNVLTVDSKEIMLSLATGLGQNERGEFYVKIATGLAKDNNSNLYVKYTYGNGLTIKDDVVSVKTGQGLSKDTNGALRVSTSGSLDYDSNGNLVVKVKPGSGLDNGAEQGMPEAGLGVVVSAPINYDEKGKVTLGYSGGLMCDSAGKLSVKASNKFEFTNNILDIRLSTGVHFDNGICLDFSETATPEANGFMSKDDKRKLDSFVFYAGRYWNEANDTPTAAGHYGSLDHLRNLPEKLGLGRYLVTDDRKKRKLDPLDSTRYADGTPAALDGTQGQCMWCWNGFYANIWKEGDILYRVVSIEKPVGNDISIWVPAGGISWLGAGVMDRTNQKLCSLISDAEQYRGGGGTALDSASYAKAPAADSPQITMLGMAATNRSTTNFGNFARKRGQGWEANWFVARFVVEFLFEVIMGTENSQAAFNADKDENGLYQGGFGTGVTDMSDWNGYNGYYPIIPTSVGLEAGDGVCLVPYSLPQTEGATGEAYKTFNVPVFFGLVHAGFGHLWRWTRGLIMDAGEEKSLVYVTPSMYADYDPATVEDKILVAECPRVEGYIKRKSYQGLCCMPTEVGGSATIRFADYFYTNANISKGLRVRAAGGGANYGANAGAFCVHAYCAASFASARCSSPLCYFEEDPIIPESQGIQ